MTCTFAPPALVLFVVIPLFVRLWWQKLLCPRKWFREWIMERKGSLVDPHNLVGHSFRSERSHHQAILDIKKAEEKKRFV